MTRAGARACSLQDRQHELDIRDRKLDATRQYVPEAVFVHMGTNKVYGDHLHTIRLKEPLTRLDYDFVDGIPEEFPIDQSKHSLFGDSKVADIFVQDYGRYFGMRCRLRGGCLNGPNDGS